MFVKTAEVYQGGFSLILKSFPISNKKNGQKEVKKNIKHNFNTKEKLSYSTFQENH